MKLIPWDVLEDFVLKPKEAANLLGKEVTAITDLRSSEVPSDGVTMLKKYPQLKPYAYVRDIADAPVFKVAVGKPGLKIR